MEALAYRKAGKHVKSDLSLTGPSNPDIQVARSAKEFPWLEVGSQGHAGLSLVAMKGQAG